jgi:hypothetical protein
MSILHGIKHLKKHGIRINVSAKGSLSIDERDLKKYTTLALKKNDRRTPRI